MNLTEKQFKTAFLSIEGVGRATLSRLQKILAKYQISELEFWSHPHKIICHEAKISELQQFNLSNFRQQNSLESYWEFLEKQKINVVFETDSNYPELLKHIDDRPLLLFTKNNLPEKINTPIAVVGTRHITSYGQYATEKIIKELAGYSITIVSGLMYGVDSYAHQLALKNNLFTIGVLGFGFNNCYPASHQKFLDDFLAQGGVIITEFAPHVGANPYNFPARNRIVAGMSLAVVVIEAGEKSGSHITATKAGDYGREVLVVPGPIGNPYCEGTKILINQGATLITKGEDVIKTLSHNFANGQKIQSKQSVGDCLVKLNTLLEQRIFDILAANSSNADELANYLKVSISDITATLSMMEIQGVIQQLGDVWIVK